MIKHNRYWLSAFNEDGFIHVRYHPVIGCGEYYNGGLDEDTVRDLSKTVFKSLEELLETKMSKPEVFHCYYDGAVAESHIEPGHCDWDDVIEAIDNIDPDLSDLCIDYVEFDMED
jgi:hypothetical protein